jgi:hypothetical protein
VGDAASAHRQATAIPGSSLHHHLTRHPERSGAARSSSRYRRAVSNRTSNVSPDAFICRAANTWWPSGVTVWNVPVVLRHRTDLPRSIRDRRRGKRKVADGDDSGVAFVDGFRWSVGMFRYMH